MKKIFFLIPLFLLPTLSLAATPAFPQPKPNFDWSDLAGIAVQEGGRQKPLDTFAREATRLITGREKFAGFPPVELLLSWMTERDSWETLPFIDASYQPLQEQLQLKIVAGKISPEELRNNAEFQLFMQGLSVKQENKEKLSELEQQGMRLYQRLGLFTEISRGEAIRLLPNAAGPWQSIADNLQAYPDLDTIQKAKNQDSRVAAALHGLISAYLTSDAKLETNVSKILSAHLRAKGAITGSYLSESALKREIFFNWLHPFRWAYLGYAAACFILLCSLFLRGHKLYGLGIALLFAVFVLHAYGFYLRVMISGRAPVTNMYETVIWVSFGVVLFSLIFEAIYRAKYYAVAASALATLGLVLADSAPNVLNPAIEPLVPVLRSNYWLTVHVMTITLSYAAFTLALGIGNVSLAYYIFKAGAQDKIQRLNYFLYRILQVGVVLLAAGTILGGVWANDSWGRFWGWDPKEVWALITLLGYLIILHGRFTGWVRGFGLSVGSIIAYMLVVMAWYGVNFILGVGLHSYGFSSGGAKFVSIFVGIELLWVAFATLRYKALKK